MKWILRIFLVAILIVVVSGFALNWFLSKGLKPAFDKARPMVEETLGVRVEIEELSVQAFLGRLNIGGLRVGNPEGFDRASDLFSLQSASNQISLMDLIFKQQVTVDEINIKESNLYLVRTSDGELNLEKLLQNLSGEEDEAEEEESETGELPPFFLDRFLLTSLLSFVQERDEKEPIRVAVEVQILADQIGTVGDPEVKNGSFRINGNLSGRKDLFVLDLSGKVAPLTDPSRPTFDLKGQIHSLEMKLFSALSRDVSLTDGMIDLRFNLSARDGAFSPESEVIMLVANPKFDEGLRIPARVAPATLRVVVPVRGSVMEPSISIREALASSIRATLMGAPTEALKAEVERLKGAAGEQVQALKDEGDKLKAEAAEKAEVLQQQAKEQQRKLLEDAQKGQIDVDSSKESLMGGLGLGGNSEESTEKREDSKDRLRGIIGGKKKDEPTDKESANASEAGLDPKSKLGGLLGGSKGSSASGLESEQKEGEEDAAEVEESVPEEKKRGLGGIIPKGFGR